MNMYIFAGIEREITAVKKQIQQEKQKEKQLYSKMFK